MSNMVSSSLAAPGTSTDERKLMSTDLKQKQGKEHDRKQGLPVSGLDNSSKFYTTTHALFLLGWKSLPEIVQAQNMQWAHAVEPPVIALNKSWKTPGTCHSSLVA